MSRDESNLVMKVMIVKEVMTGDISPVAMFLWRTGIFLVGDGDFLVGDGD